MSEMKSFNKEESKILYPGQKGLNLPQHKERKDMLRFKYEITKKFPQMQNFRQDSLSISADNPKTKEGLYLDKETNKYYYIGKGLQLEADSITELKKEYSQAINSPSPREQRNSLENLYSGDGSEGINNEITEEDVKNFQESLIDQENQQDSQDDGIFLF